MTKLTMYMRESIAKAATKHKYGKQLQAFEEAETKLAIRAADDIYGKDVIEAAKLFPNQNLIKQGRQISVNAGGYSIDLSSYDQNTWIIGGGNGWSSRHPIKNEKLAGEIRTHRYEFDQLKKESRDAEYKLVVTLKAISTLNMLKKQWPEGEPFYKKYEKVGTVNLPTVQFEKINKDFGLPIEETAV